MTLLQAVLEVGAALAVVAAIMLCLWRVVGWARRRQRRAYVLGAALAPFMAFGNVVDPDYRIVHEAKQHKKGDEGEPGDPPADDAADMLVTERPPARTAKPRAKRILAAGLPKRQGPTFA